MKTTKFRLEDAAVFVHRTDGRTVTIFLVIDGTGAFADCEVRDVHSVTWKEIGNSLDHLLETARRRLYNRANQQFRSGW